MTLTLGDRVRVLDSNDAPVEVGGVYEIVRINVYTFGEREYVIDDGNGNNWYFSEEHLELVENHERTVVSDETTIRGAVLLEAKDLIEGDRNITYGEPTENFKNIASMWNILFAHKLSEPLTARDVAQAMIALKQCRTITQPKRDNFVDIAGYAAIGWEAEESS